MLWDTFRVTLRKSDFCKHEESSSDRQWTPGKEFLTLPQYFLISHCWYWTVCDWHWLQPKMTDYKQTTLPSFSRLCGHASCSLVQVNIFQPVYVCVNFSDVAHGVVLQLGLMQGLIHSHLVVVVTLQEDSGFKLNDILWCGCNPRLNYGSLNQNQEMGPGICLELVKNKQTKSICKLMNDFSLRFLLHLYHCRHSNRNFFVFGMWQTG